MSKLDELLDALLKADDDVETAEDSQQGDYPCPAEELAELRVVFEAARRAIEQAWEEMRCVNCGRHAGKIEN